MPNPKQRDVSALETQEQAAAGASASAGDGGPQASSVATENRTFEPDTGPEEGTPTIAGYEVLGVLGRGGMGVVYQARQVHAHRLVALKMILTGTHAGPGDLARFRTEAQAVARLQHPHIVQIYEVGEHNGLPFFSLELCAGGSLARQLDGTPWPGDRAACLVEKLARAMHAAHECHIIHRDLKPGNILLTGAGEPRVTDFGLAKKLDDLADQTQTGAVMGTPSYMAPEQAAGKTREVGPAADVYALGAVLYELLTGRPPFRGPTRLDTLWQVTQTEPVAPSRLNPRAPRDLETICLKCLQKAPGKRYATAADLAEDLRRFRSGEPITARRVGRAERLWRWCKRNPAPATAIGLGLVAVVAVVALLLGSVFFLEQSRAAEQLRREQDQTKAALAEAQRQGKIAREQRRRAEQQHQLAMKYRRQAEHLSADIALDRGTALCEDGYVGQGLMWLAQGLKGVPAREAELQRTARVRLAAWHHQLHPLRSRWQAAGMRCRPAFSSDCRMILTDHWDNSARCREVETGKPVGPPLPHPAAITAVALSPDGSLALVCGLDHQARLWDVRAGKQRGAPLPHQAPIFRALFSADGQKVLTCGKDFQARLWEVRGGKPVGPWLKIKRDVGGIHDYWFWAALSRDGRLAFVTTSTQNAVEIWDTGRGEVVGKPLKHQQRVFDMAVSPDGRLAATASQDQTAQVWEVPTGHPVGPPLHHHGLVTRVAFSPDGGTLATASTDNRVQLWAVTTGKPRTAPVLHKAWVTAITFSPDGKTFLTAGLDSTVRLWERATGMPLGAPLEHQGTIQFAGFDAGGRQVMTHSAEDLVNVWEVVAAEPPSRVLQHGGPVFAVAFSPDGRTALTGSGDNRAQLWDVATGRRSGPPLEHQAAVRALAFSPDSKLALTAGSHDKTARLWDVATGKPKGPPLQHQAVIDAVAFSPDGRVVLTGSGDHTARLWDVATGKPAGGPLKHQAEAIPVAFSPDGRLVLTAAGRVAQLWEVATGRAKGPPLRHLDTISSAAFSPDGRTVVTAGMDTTARLWNVATGQPLHGPLKHPWSIWAVGFGPDGRTVWTGGAFGAARWDVRTGRSLGRPLWLPYHNVRSLDLSRDGRILLTGTFEGPPFLWETATGKLLGPYLPHWNRTPLYHGNRVVAISPDIRHALTASVDGTARLWKLPAPVAGDVERLVAWTQVLTGLEMDDTGALRAMNAAAWRQCRNRLEKLGGTPLP